MKKTLRLAITLLASAFIPLASAGEQTFPAKAPVLKFVAPEKWKTEVDKKDGSIAVNSPDGRVSVNFGEVPVAASMEIFAKMLPEMVKVLNDATVAEKAKEHSEDGLTGFTATYIGKIENKPAMCIFVLFKGGAERAILDNIVVSDPGTLPKEDDEAIGNFMKSLKGAAQK
ncbi:hypothetical protein LBMAG57_22770 [Verrucomicrobiota bacterium]|nr:hypothetical protein LBMAG57_22770 [Verrucomicrobiota bacterium]